VSKTRGCLYKLHRSWCSNSTWSRVFAEHIVNTLHTYTNRKFYISCILFLNVQIKMSISPSICDVTKYLVLMCNCVCVCLLGQLLAYVCPFLSCSNVLLYCNIFIYLLLSKYINNKKNKCNDNTFWKWAILSTLFLCNRNECLRRIWCITIITTITTNTITSTIIIIIFDTGHKSWKIHHHHHHHHHYLATYICQ